MKQRSSALRGALALAAAAALGGCGGSANATGSPSVIPSANPGLTTALRAGRGTAQIALASVHAHLLAAQFLRPGSGPLVPAAPSAPTCDPSGNGTATATAPDLSNSYYYTRFAFYPAGDATCSQAPLVIGVLAYPSPSGSFAPQSGQPLNVTGYLVGYAPPNDPYYKPGTPLDVDGIGLTVFEALDGRANLALSVVGETRDVAAPVPLQPSAGSFPASFPRGAPTTLPGQPRIASNLASFPTYAVFLEHGGTVDTTVVSDVAPLLKGAAFDPGGLPVDAQGNLSATGAGALAAGTSSSWALNAAGGGTLFAGALAAERPSFAFDLAAQSPIPLTGFPPAAGQLGFAVSAQSISLGSPISGAANFPHGADADSGIFSGGAAAAAVDEKYVDALNGVAAEVVSSPDGYRLTLTDLIAGKPLTTPAVVVLDVLGNAAPFSYAFDGSNGAVRDFVVTE